MTGLVHDNQKLLYETRTVNKMSNIKWQSIRMYKMNESGRNKLYNVSDMCHTTLVFDMACASTFECHCTTFPSRPVLDIFTQKSTYVTHLLLCAMREKEKKNIYRMQ